MLRTDVWQNAFDPNANYGNSITDMRHNLNGAVVYRLPFGKGEHFVNNSSVADAFVGGWQASGIFLIHTGFPFTPVIGTANNSGAISGTWFPNRVGSGVLSNPTHAEWFNPAAFTTPAQYTFGRLRKEHPLWAWVWQYATSASQRRSIFTRASNCRSGRTPLDLFNHPNCGQPNTSVGAGVQGSGVISSVIDSRVIQLGAVLRF